LATGGARPYDVTPDGRFVLIKTGDATTEDEPRPDRIFVQERVRGAEAARAGELTQNRRQETGGRRQEKIFIVLLSRRRKSASADAAREPLAIGRGRLSLVTP